MILLDGRPITDYPLAVLHRDISYVPQENFLFSDTLEENIAFGLEDRIADNPAILDAVKQAAKDACIHVISWAFRMSTRPWLESAE